MSDSPEIWVAFARTFSMLFLVLALLILAFYLIKRFSEAKGARGNKNYIRVLATHHLSPKEKLMLIHVPGETLLVGITPAHINKITTIDQQIELPEIEPGPSSRFSEFLSRKIGQTAVGRTKKGPVKEQVS